jgi:hypothetical protein
MGLLPLRLFVRARSNHWVTIADAVFLSSSLFILRMDWGSVHLPLIDLDFLKSVNDRFGHQTGDAVIRRWRKRFGIPVAKSTSLLAMAGKSSWSSFRKPTFPVLYSSQNAYGETSKRPRSNASERPLRRLGLPTARSTRTPGMSSYESQTRLSTSLRIVAGIRSPTSGTSSPPLREIGPLPLTSDGPLSSS